VVDVSRDIISVEVDRPCRSVPQWEEALSRHVGKVPAELRDQEITKCIPATAATFRARLECGALGDAVLYKLRSTPNRYSRTLRDPLSTTIPAPILLGIQLNGSNRFHQSKNSYVLRPGDWCLVDTQLPFDYWTGTESSELLVLTLQRPSAPEQQLLLDRGLAHRFAGTIGTSRVLESTLVEIFDQMNSIAPSSGSGLQHAVTTMAWDALREQVTASSQLSYLDAQRARLKAYIDSQIADPALSVETVARACGLSARSVHRVFALDPAGSVSAHIWKRRVHRCADELRDAKDRRRSIAEICRSSGFSSEAHFSRVFKEHFGVPPRAYRNGQ
jgi:AraC-like DNA-binding protein